jgi:hypothetical protein
MSQSVKAPAPASPPPGPVTPGFGAAVGMRRLLVDGQPRLGWTVYRSMRLLVPAELLLVPAELTRFESALGAAKLQLVPGQPGPDGSAAAAGATGLRPRESVRVEWLAPGQQDQDKDVLNVLDTVRTTLTSLKGAVTGDDISLDHVIVSSDSTSGDSAGADGDGVDAGGNGAGGGTTDGGSVEGHYKVGPTTPDQIPNLPPDPNVIVISAPMDEPDEVPTAFRAVGGLVANANVIRIGGPGRAASEAELERALAGLLARTGTQGTVLMIALSGWDPSMSTPPRARSTAMLDALRGPAVGMKVVIAADGSAGQGGP